MRWFHLALALLPVAAAADSPAPTLIVPDGAGILDLAAAEQAESFDAIPNPFRIRYLPPPPIREVALVISTVLIPDRPDHASAVINGHLYSPGDIFEGLKLSRIAADNLELRRDDLILRVPVQDKPSKLRLSP